MQATGKEFISAVDVGLLGLVHQVELLLQAKATSVGAGLERLVAGQNPLFDLGLQEDGNIKKNLPPQSTSHTNLLNYLRIYLPIYTSSQSFKLLIERT